MSHDTHSNAYFLEAADKRIQGEGLLRDAEVLEAKAKALQKAELAEAGQVVEEEVVEKPVKKSSKKSKDTNVFPVKEIKNKVKKLPRPKKK